MNLPSLEKRIEVRNRPDQYNLLFQNWRNLAFIHWKYSVDVLQNLLPKGLFVDTFENEAYIGIVPFLMRDVRPSFLPSGSNFCEMNVRTYVYNERGEPGVWFFSLDANHWLTVQMASLFYFLPYHYANFITYGSYYECARENNLPTQFSYKPSKELGFAKPGSLEFFLVERYLLFTTDRSGNLYKARIYHKPYYLNELILEKWDENALIWNHLPEVKRPPDNLLYSPGVNVETFRIQLN